MVAWEKQLEERSVPEWKDKYVAYAMLKRKLERLKCQSCGSREQARVGGSEMKLRDYGRAPLLAYEDPPSECEQADVSADSPNGTLPAEFVDAVISELRRVSDWYEGSVTKLESSVRRLTREDAGSDDAGLFNQPLGIQPVDVANLHLQAVQLTEYVMLNSEALRKIVKKADKQCHTSFQSVFVSEHLRRSSLATAGRAVFDGRRARDCRRRLEGLVSSERLQELRSVAMASGKGAGLTKLVLRPRRVLACTVIAALSFLAGPHVLPGTNSAQRCFVLVLFIVSLWVTEAAPFEATAMLVPPLAVFLGVVEGPAVEVSHRFLGAVFNDSLYLVLCGYVIGSIFSSCQLDCRAASLLQQWLGDKPFLFLFAVMLLGVGLSALVSNVTAPLLLVEVLKPLLRDMPTDSRYSRALLIGLAFACNIGGMTTPISSPQNVAALQTLKAAGGNISWWQWLSVSFPFCIVSVTVAWVLLLLLYQYDLSDAERERDASRTSREKAIAISPVVFEQDDFSIAKAMSLGSAAGTLVAFSCSSFADFLGGTPCIAMLFVSVSLGTGLISRQTFNSYSWHLLFLIGGGNALGLAVRESGLLGIIANAARDRLSQNPWWLVLELVAVLLFAASFVSHTVAALVLMPLVVELGKGAGIAETAVLLGALASSAACALPMSSFPNVNSLLATDDIGMPWLSVKHIIRAGVPMTLLSGLLLGTIGYWLCKHVCN
eukprot:TRINITY_DN49592_c0_g1_i1.p1 TRINITY_DN49592_c0_g1~~TRINITY_DN49592_c0_g1_i1.p1  ORF type:complete len:717 (-),score=97.70 TRINITY_DN49592_c0_g1_i1:80-2230(-)